MGTISVAKRAAATIYLINLVPKKLIRPTKPVHRRGLFFRRSTRRQRGSSGDLAMMFAAIRCASSSASKCSKAKARRSFQFSKR
jgi:hypothetical protein